ncbi:MAG: hypothetical protein QQN63_03410 [Nitrosopumilus sp.]
MIFKYKGYGYRLKQRDQDHIWYKIKKLKWHWYKRAEILKRGYDSAVRWVYVEREEHEITEEFILRTHLHCHTQIDKFVIRDEKLQEMKELLHEPNMDFISRVIK